MMTRRFRIAATAFAVLLLPWPTRVAPAWKVQAVDEAGDAIPFLLARQRWRDPSAMGEALERTRITDVDGRASFPSRWAWGSTVERVYRLSRHDYTCGLLHAQIVVWDAGYTAGVATRDAGAPSPQRVQVRVDPRPRRAVIGRAARLKAYGNPGRGRKHHCPGGI